MTRDLQRLFIWCGAAVVALIIIGTVLGMRAGTLAERNAQAEQLYAKYRTLYPESGIPASEALPIAKRLSEQQQHELKDAEAQTVAVLPDEYQRSDVNQASSRLSADLATIRQRAERQKITLPADLPFEKSGISDDSSRCTLQLAQLFAYKQIISLAMDAGLPRITLIKEGAGYRDAAGAYAVLPVECAVEGSWEACSLFIEQLRVQHPQGLGLRDLRFEAQGDVVKASLLVTLITVNNPVWQLRAIDAVPGNVPTAPSASPQGTPTRRSRLSGK